MGHQGNYDVRLTHPLPQSNLLAVYVRTRPHPPSPTEVKGHKSELPYGYLLILKYCEGEGEEGRVCLCPEPVVRLVTVCQEDVIVDMCHVKMDKVDQEQSCEVLVVVTVCGELQLLDVESLQVCVRESVYVVLCKHFW